MSPTSAAASGSPAKRGAPQPGFAFHRVALDAVARHQREAPARLGAAMALLGGLLVAGGGGGAVLRHAEAAFVNHAVEVQRGRQALLRRLAQMLEQFRLGFRVAGVARQHQGVAKLALRTAAGGGFLVPAVAFLELRRSSGPERQDEAQHRLALGRSAFGGAPRPFGSARIIRLGRGLAAEQAGADARPGLGEARRHPVQAQRGEQRLRLDIALGRGALDPAHAVRSAGRHAGAFQVAAADPELGLGNAGPGGAGQQGERALRVALFL